MANLSLQVVLTALDKATRPLKAITDGSKKTAQQMRETRDELKRLESAQRDMKAFQRLKDQTRSSSEQLAKAQERLRGFSNQLRNMKAPDERFQKSFIRAKADVDKLTAAHERQRAALLSQRKAMADAAGGLGRMSDYERRLAGQIDSTSGKLAGQREHMQQLAQQKQRINAHREVYDSTMATRNRLAVNGAVGVGVGYGTYRALHDPIEQAKEFDKERARMGALGFKEDVVKHAMHFASEHKQYGTSELDRAELMRDAMSVFGDEHHAQEVLPLMAKMQFANKAMFGDEAGADNSRKMMDMLKVIELRGGLNSPAEFEKQANMIQQVITATGGRVNADEYLNAIKTGGLSLKQMDSKAFYYMAEPLIQEMGGDRVGTAMMSGYQNLYQGKTTKVAAGKLAELGLIGDKKKVKFDKVGQDAYIGPGALLNGELFKKNQFEWIKTVLIPQLAKKGITGKNAISDAIGSIITNRTAAGLYSTYVQQMESIDKRAGINESADNINQLNDKAQQQASGKELELAAKKADLYRVLGQTVLPVYSKALEVMSGVLESVTKWMERHPRKAQAMITALMGFGAVAAVMGTLGLALASILGPFAAVKYALAMLGVRSGKSAGLLRKLGGVVKRFSSLLVRVVPWALGIVGRAVMMLGRAMMANPILAIIGLIAIAAYEIYQHWDTVSRWLVKVWDKVKGPLLDLYNCVSEAWKNIKQAFIIGMQLVTEAILHGSPFGALYDTVKKILGWFGVEMPEDFVQAGAALMDGLSDGFTGRLGRLKDAITGAGSAAIGWIKEKFSWVGNTLGMTSVQLDPRVAEFASQLPLSVAPTAAQRVDIGQHTPIVAGGAGQGITNNNQYSISIADAGGHSPHAIARAVRDEIQKHEQQRDARSRSRIRD